MDAEAPEPPLHCSANPSLPATAFCTVCAEPYSGKFLGVRPDGRAVCFACARRQDIELVRVGPRPGSGDPIAGRGWLRATFLVASRPHEVFAAGYDGPIVEAVALGYAATLAGFVTTTAWDLGLVGDEYLQFLVAQAADANLELTTEAARSFLWISAPIVAAMRFGLGALLFHLGARTMVGGRSRLGADVRAFALASSTLFFCVVPALGPFVALATWFFASMVYLQQQYGLRSWRSSLAVLPSLLTIAWIGPYTFVPAGPG